MQQIDKKNTAFTAVIKHDEKSITRLAKVQYNVFQMGKKAIFVLSGVFLILKRTKKTILLRPFIKHAP